MKLTRNSTRDLFWYEIVWLLAAAVAFFTTHYNHLYFTSAIAFVWAGIVGAVASWKGRSEISWFCAGYCFGIWPLVILVFLKKQTQEVTK